ncbi:MAG: FHA domain-containing protein [Labilithrix sp.]|nr:FHA domain-containing protein [Labilithrix sp.]MCW5834635.1 FHA domain-containing protein [Labilithrix sp.]
MHRTAIVTRADTDETLDLPLVSAAVLPRTSFTLRIVAGPDAGNVLVLDPASPPHAVLGQASSCAIQLRDPHVSRRHVALTATATHILLVDLGSTNGTRVNGVLVREARLYGGETVSLGRTMLGVETDQVSAANVPATLPPPADDFVGNVIGEQLPFTEARQRVLAEFERRYVDELLARHNGNVTHAARASGIAHRYFQLVRARSR